MGVVLEHEERQHRLILDLPGEHMLTKFYIKIRERLARGGEDRGGALMEYGVVVVIVGIIALVVWQVLGNESDGLIGNLSGRLEEAARDILGER
jgi:Flp pilus assembly pilin Flp